MKKIWYLFDYMCGKRLAVVLRTTVDTLIEAGELKVSSAVRQKLSRISPATIDRLLAGEKKKLRLKGHSLTKPATLLKHQIPYPYLQPVGREEGGISGDRHGGS